MQVESLYQGRLGGSSLHVYISVRHLREISSYPYFKKKVRNGGCYISLSFTGSHSKCVNTLLFCVGM